MHAPNMANFKFGQKVFNKVLGIFIISCAYNIFTVYDSSQGMRERPQ